MANSPIVHVIDDDRDVRESLSFLLETAGLAVRAFESGAAFLDSLPRAEKGCVVSGTLEGADVGVVNTCSFIGPARDESEGAIRDLLVEQVTATRRVGLVAIGQLGPDPQGRTTVLGQGSEHRARADLERVPGDRIGADREHHAVVDADGGLVGLIDEVDLLNHLLEHDGTHSQDEAIDGLVQIAQAVYPPESTLDECMPSLTEGFALLVMEAGKPVGILTKIDVLDYVAGKI